jgi:hypothetical protein
MDDVHLVVYSTLWVKRAVQSLRIRNVKARLIILGLMYFCEQRLKWDSWLIRQTRREGNYEEQYHFWQIECVNAVVPWMKTITFKFK